MAMSRKQRMRQENTESAEESGLHMDCTHFRLSAKAMQFDAAAEAIHPNAMPFKGVLTRVGVPSDEAPHGSPGGKRVLLTEEAAANAAPSLVGMGVDITADFDGHNAQHKIGVITASEVNGTDLLIEGIIYALDFPKEAAFIKNNKSALGFSFEACNVDIRSLSDDPLVITGCTFTGAAILEADKAAYRTTSLAASQAKQELDMSPEEIQALLASALEQALRPVQEEVRILRDGVLPGIQAAAEVRAKLEPHIRACEACADGMEAAGIGTHPSQGHVAHLRRVANDLRAAASNGEIPSRFNGGPIAWAAAADLPEQKPVVVEKPHLDAAAVATAVENATKPLLDQIAGMGTKIADIQAAQIRAAEVAPARKTMSAAAEVTEGTAPRDGENAPQALPPQVALMAKRYEFKLPPFKEDGKISLLQLDNELMRVNASRHDRMILKNELQLSGMIS